MSNATPMTVTGWVANDLSVSTTQTGKRYVNVNVPHQRQKKNQQGGYDNQGGNHLVPGNVLGRRGGHHRVGGAEAHEGDRVGRPGGIRVHEG
jgi:hypothetical protein